MGVQIPTWLLGRHVTSCTIRWQVPDGSGVLGNGTGSTQTLTGLIDELNYAGHDDGEDVAPLNATYRNQETLERNDTIVVSEILRQPAASSLLALVYENADNADYAIFTFTRGGNSFSMIAYIDSYVETSRRGKNTGRMTLLHACAIDSVTGLELQNPTYS
jgi:hypothetical protein